MRTSRLNWWLLGKIAVAIFALGALAGVAGSSLAPQVPLVTVLLYSFCLAAALFSVLLVAAGVTVAWAEFSLRNGGTDPQWFWFASEPPGLAKVRAQMAEEASHSAK